MNSLLNWQTTNLFLHLPLMQTTKTATYANSFHQFLHLSLLAQMQIQQSIFFFFVFLYKQLPFTEMEVAYKAINLL